MKAMREAVGQHVELFGTGFAAHTGHHRRPLVVEVDQLIVFDRARQRETAE
jgi:hypothetical protein